MMFLNGQTSTFFAIVIVSFTLLLNTTTTSKAGQIDYSAENRCVIQCLKKGNLGRGPDRVWCESASAPTGNYKWYWNRYKQVKSEYEKSISLCVNYGTHNGDDSGGGNYDKSKCVPWRNLVPKYQLAVNNFNTCKKSLRAFNKCSNYCIKFRRTRLPEPPVPRVPAKWVRCAGENQTCSFAGSTEVLYGVAGTAKKWARRTMQSPVRCNNGTFGDPAPGQVKSCYIFK